MSETNIILLVDGNALVHRAFHGIPPLTNPKGQLVNAVYGFFRILLSAINDCNPTHIVVAFDVSGPTFRDEIYEHYKAKRVKPPQSLYDQFPLVQELLKTLNIPIVTAKGYEGDDVIGTLCKNIKNQKANIKNTNQILKIIILTGDKDTYQLIDNDVTILIPKKGISSATFIDKKEFIHQYGFEPQYMVDYKAIAGDPSDNIPGVHGIGDKGARTLIAQYHTIDAIYKHLDDLPYRIAQKLEASRKEVALSQTLAQIAYDAPVSLTIDDARIHDYDDEHAQKAFLSFGFKSIIPLLPHSDRKKEIREQKTLF